MTWAVILLTVYVIVGANLFSYFRKVALGWSRKRKYPVDATLRLMVLKEAAFWPWTLLEIYHESQQGKHEEN